MMREKLQNGLTKHTTTGCFEHDGKLENVFYSYVCECCDTEFRFYGHSLKLENGHPSLASYHIKTYGKRVVK